MLLRPCSANLFLLCTVNKDGTYTINALHALVEVLKSNQILAVPGILASFLFLPDWGLAYFEHNVGEGRGWGLSVCV